MIYSTGFEDESRELTLAQAIAHQSWIDYMNKPSHGLTGAVCSTYLTPCCILLPIESFLTNVTPQVVAVYIAGEAGGALTQTFIGDKLGRIRFMQLMCVVVTIGTIIQTASINIGMFLAGRVLAGYAVG